jgi:hypothetical protein
MIINDFPESSAEDVVVAHFMTFSRNGWKVSGTGVHVKYHQSAVHSLRYKVHNKLIYKQDTTEIISLISNFATLFSKPQTTLICL